MPFPIVIDTFLDKDKKKQKKNPFPILPGKYETTKDQTSKDSNVCSKDLEPGLMSGFSEFRYF